jgi:ATP dependent DNA ligase domain
MQRVKVRHAGAVARHELAIDDTGAHAGQARKGIDHPTHAASSMWRKSFRRDLRPFPKQHPLCVWAFDLLHHNGRDLRELPLIERKARLEKLIRGANADWLRYSEPFDDGLKLLAEADHFGLEGIVSKRTDAPYRSGKPTLFSGSAQSSENRGASSDPGLNVHLFGFGQRSIRKFFY